MGCSRAGRVGPDRCRTGRGSHQTTNCETRAGKSKGYRVIIFFRRSDKVFFVYGFSKSQRANVNNQEEQQFKEAAKTVLALTETQLAVRFKRGDLVEARNE